MPDHVIDVFLLSFTLCSHISEMREGGFGLIGDDSLMGLTNTTRMTWVNQYNTHEL